MNTFALMRHAKIRDNDLDPESRGLLQSISAQFIEKLSELGPLPKFVRIFHSPRDRAKLTAIAFASALNKSGAVISAQVSGPLHWLEIEKLGVTGITDEKIALETKGRGNTFTVFVTSAYDILMYAGGKSPDQPPAVAYCTLWTTDFTIRGD